MKKTILSVACALILSFNQVASAGTCSCKSQIENASAEVSGSCSKIWSNNHCTLKEDSAATARLNDSVRDLYAATQSRFHSALERTGVYSEQEIKLMLPTMLEFGYLAETHRLCNEKAEIPIDLFETYVTGSLLSASPDAEINLLVSENTYIKAIEFGRELRVGENVCIKDDIVSESSDNFTIKFGNACFAGGREDENFAISFSAIRGCPDDLAF